MEYAKSDVSGTDRIEQLRFRTREDPPQLCIITRDKRTSTYKLCQSLGPPPAMKEGHFLLAARKVWRATSIEYLIFLHPDTSRGSSITVLGKLRSNFLGSKFTLYDSEPVQNLRAVFCPCFTSGLRMSFNEISPTAHIAYFPHYSGPRRMQCTLHRIPTSTMDPGNESPPNPSTGFSISAFFASQSNPPGADCSVADFESMNIGLLTRDAPLVLKSKAPRWNDQLREWYLNFRDDRVTVASAKNFQLVDAASSLERNLETSSEWKDLDKVLLQFGKIDENRFSMDFCYPLSAFEAFAIFLSSVDDTGGW